MWTPWWPISGPGWAESVQLAMPTSRRLLLPALLLLAAGLAFLLWLRQASPPASTPPSRPVVAALRSEPRSLNRLAAADRGSLVLSLLLHGRLVRINHRTQELEPALAERWTLAPDGRTYTLDLRQNVRFSDGTPFTAADVVFTFEALYDERFASPMAGELRIDGQPLTVAEAGPHQVTVTFPAPHGPGLRLLAGLPILPAHRLRQALADGTLAQQWTLATPPDAVAGLGPFVFRGYTPGERIELARNPHYWAGGPAIDRLVLRIIPSQNAELLAFEGGEIDLMYGEVRPDDIAAVRRLAAAGRAQVFDLGTALDADALWFHLGPAKGRPAADRPWLDVRFRRAISHAIDRRAFVDTVLLGAGTPIEGPVTPGNRQWHVSGPPRYPHDPARARALLAEAGLTDRDGDGRLETASGRPARFELVTQKGHATRERAAAFIEADLERIGLTVDVVTLESTALLPRLTSGQYDAAYFGLSASDTDPTANLAYWLSSGPFHVWHPRQTSPATPWEREIDTLMHQITQELDPDRRKAQFARVQEIFAEQQPAIFIAAPTLTIAASSRLRGLEPGVFFPYVLWRADRLETQ